ncbi:MAG: folylpolyglutamate synthase/dihydrofolate synthase family protein [Weeksellaceae bacterium]|jgi:dihydrofolate synthase/folylpolyglutamate synthase|nr:folylpolyglutamate synthase/dihydrofolate synthase family protein [Weeksellaceae bacterium]
MNYEETLRWLDQKLPMFQRSGNLAYKEDIGNITKLCEHLGNPQKKLKCIHIAGTNGKGSTSHMIASVLQSEGYKVGLTTSPHFKDFRERIRVNGEICTKEFVLDFVKKNAAFIESVQASFFEVAVAMAFSYFEKQKVDFAVVETGLGGRLDATNIIHPILSVITNIGWDHTSLLGNTLEKIAFEKAGIIKPKVPVIIGEASQNIAVVFMKKAKELTAEIVFSESLEIPDYPSDLKGIYQTKNKKTVVAAIRQLRKSGYVISEKSLQEGLINVVKNTGLRGRWEILQTQPLIVVDTAHNTHGLQEIQKQLNQTSYEKLHLVLGFVNDKDVESILKFFPENAYYYFSAPDVFRKFEIQELKKIVPKNLDSTYFTSIKEAFNRAKNSASKNDFIYVGGSTFVVAEVLDFEE